jgi:hypothetical protein
VGKINVIGPDGRVVSVDEEVATRAINAGADVPLAGAGAEGELAAEKARHERYGGVLGTLAAGVAGGLDTLTLGGYGAGVTALGGGEAYRGTAAEHPTARGLGEAGALLVPGLAEVGLGGRIGKGVAAATESTRAARLAEGAAYGVGGTIASANASGDPLTVESLVIGAGVGGLLNYSAGALGDRFSRVGAAARAEGALARKAEAAGEILDSPSPAYEGLVSAREASIDAARTFNAGVKRRAEAMRRFTTSTEDFVRTRNGFNKAIGEVFTRFVVPEADPEMRAAAMDVINRAEPVIARATEQRVLNPERAVDLLRPLREELAGRFDVVVPDLPEPVGAPVDVPRALPKTLRDFSRLRPETVAEIANGSGPDAAAVARLADELGVAPSVGPGATLADIHTTLAEHSAAVDAMTAAADDPRVPPFIKALRWAARKTVRTAVGGAIGSALPIPGGKLLGELIGFTAGDAAANASMQAKSALRDGIRDIVGRIGEPAARAQRALGPVTAYLSRAFPSGKRDRETDIGALAMNRARDLRAAALTAPDTFYHAVAPLSGSGTLAVNAHRTVINALQHAADAAPRDPGTAPHGTGSDWRARADEGIALAYRLEALAAPLDAIRRAMAGDVHPAAIDQLRASWPASLGALMAEMQDAGDVPVERMAGLSALSGVPKFALDNPLNTISLQGMYLPKPEPEPQGRRGGGGGVPGRPSASGRSEVAGSSVEKLLNQ